MKLDKFTQKSQEAIFQAQEIARDYHHQNIEPAHLLLALMRRRGAIASRIELLREVWGAGAAVSRRAVDTHIARLRRKLEDDPANPRHILTALAWGYRFRP